MLLGRLAGYPVEKSSRVFSETIEWVGCGPFPGCQWQIKVYGDSLLKL